MTVAHETVPALVAPGRTMRLTLTASIGNHVKLFARNAPPGSTLRAKLDAVKPAQSVDGSGVVVDSGRRLLVTEARSGVPFSFALDVGGRYTFSAQEITQGATEYGGGYQGSPDGAASETIHGETELSLFVGQRLVMPIGIGSDSCELVVWVWDDRIQATSADVHGETTPALINPSTQVAANTLGTAPVRAALSALKGQLAAACTGDSVAMLADIVAKYNAHLTAPGVHSEGDTRNAVSGGIASGGNNDQAIAEAINAVRRHFRNDANDPTGDPPLFGDGTAGYHSAYDSLSAFAPSGAADRVCSIAALWRAFEAHRVSPIHSAPDAGNALAPLPKLPALVVAFMEALSGNAGTPLGQSPGAHQLMTVAGFEEAPL